MEWKFCSAVIGPQGVLDVVNMTGQLVKKFADPERNRRTGDISDG